MGSQVLVLLGYHLAFTCCWQNRAVSAEVLPALRNGHARIISVYYSQKGDSKAESRSYAALSVGVFVTSTTKSNKTFQTREIINQSSRIQRTAQSLPWTISFLKISMPSLTSNIQCRCRVMIDAESGTSSESSLSLCPSSQPLSCGKSGNVDPVPAEDEEGAGVEAACFPLPFADLWLDPSSSVSLQSSRMRRST